MAITVLFSCSECGLVDAEAKVRGRRDDEDVVRWMEKVCAREVARRHQILSFGCEARSFQNLKIPIDKSDSAAWIGKQTDIVPPKGDGSKGSE